MGRKQAAARARQQEAEFTVESLEPRLLLSATTGSEQSEGVCFSLALDPIDDPAQSGGAAESQTVSDGAADSIVTPAQPGPLHPAEDCDAGLAEVTATLPQGVVAQDCVRAIAGSDRTESGESQACAAFGSPGFFEPTEELITTLHGANPPPPGSVILSTEAADATTGLDPILEEAIRQWSSLPIAEGFQDRLTQVKIEVIDLGDTVLAQTRGETILLDPTAAGYGWFIDPTPGDNREFAGLVDSGRLCADTSSPAYGHIDLLTVVAHELGHVLGFEDLDPTVDPAAVMAGALSLGQRRLVADSVGLLLTPS